MSKEGEACIKVTYPKFKLGEEVGRDVAVPPTYSEYHNSILCKLNPKCRKTRYIINNL